MYYGVCHAYYILKSVTRRTFYSLLLFYGAGLLASAQSRRAEGTGFPLATIRD
jgi:hypothetical protein